MSVAFLIPTPPPVLPAAEAYAQEIAGLRQRFGGEVFYVNPNRFLPRHLPVQLPRPLFGFHCLPRLLLAGRRHRIFQLYSPDLYPYPVLSLLPRPVVFTLTGSAAAVPDRLASFRRFAAVTVPDRGSLERLRAAGLGNVHRVRAGIDTVRFEPRPIDVGEEVHLLMASAPWTREQFQSKGVDALLEAAVREPRLRLTLLWRGVLAAEARRRIRERGLDGRVELVDELVEVDRILAGVHATINLAEHGNIVKAFPHSLMESLAAGRPVLISRAIAMADYVAARGVGAVVAEVTPESILAALGELLEGYGEARRRAVACGRRDFSLAAMTDSFATVYAGTPGWDAAAAARGRPAASGVEGDGEAGAG